MPNLECASCPPMVIAVLERQVREASESVAGLKAFARVLNDAFSAISDDMVEAIKDLVDKIPDPVAFDFSTLTDFLTCPLTPLALFSDPGTDLTKLDPRALLDKVKATIKDYTRAIRSDFEAGLKGITGARILSVIRNYETAIVEYNLNAVTVANATLIASTVMATCGDDQKGSVFETFLEDISDWSISIIPSDLEGQFAAVMEELMKAQTKFAAWTGIGVAV